MITKAFYKDLAQSISKAQRSILIVSPYVTEKGVEVILNALGKRKFQRPLRLGFVTLPQGSDYITGFVEPKALLLLQNANFEVRVLDRLHAKIYVIDDETLFVGSANATGYGFGNVKGYNKEIMLQSVLSPDDVTRIKMEYFDVALPPNPPITKQYVADIQSMAKKYKAKNKVLIKEYPLPPKLPDPPRGSGPSDSLEDKRTLAMRTLQSRGVIKNFERAGQSDFVINGTDAVKLFYSAVDPVSEKYSFDIVESTGEDIRSGKYRGILLALGESAILGIPTNALKKLLLRKNKTKIGDWQFKVYEMEGRWQLQLGKGKSKKLIDVNDYLWKVPAGE